MIEINCENITPAEWGICNCVCILDLFVFLSLPIPFALPPTCLSLIFLCFYLCIATNISTTLSLSLSLSLSLTLSLSCPRPNPCLKPRTTLLLSSVHCLPWHLYLFHLLLSLSPSVSLSVHSMSLRPCVYLWMLTSVGPG